MAAPRITAAVCGTGFIGTVHAEGIRRAGGRVLGVLGSTPASTARAADRLDTDAFASFDAVLASDADVVHIATPNVLHAEQALAALAAGKHVVCEKPLTTDVADARRLVAAAQASGLVHATCFNFRFYPLVHEARARVAAGDAGDVHLVTGSYLQDWLLYDTDWNWRLDDAVGGATRAVADIGSHWFDLAQFVTGQPITRLFADLQTVHRTRRRPGGEVETFTRTTGPRREVAVSTDDAASVLLRFANGAHGSMTASQVSPGQKNNLSIEVDGGAGSLAWSSVTPDQLWLGHRDRPNESLFRDPGALHPSAAAITFYPIGHVEGFAESFRGLLERVYADVASGGPRPDPAYPTFADGLRGMAIDDAVRRSAAAGTWIDVEGTTP